MRIEIVLIFIYLVTSNCTYQQSSTNYSDLNWLEGEWIYESKNGILIEKWEEEKNQLLIGKSYFIKNLDTVYFEELKIEKVREHNKENIYYQALVSNQNKGQPIRFKLISKLNADTLRFENKLHDFPQYIVYQKPKNDTLKTFIEGFQQGKYRRVNFTFIKK
ncbi:MAG TPA: DUF6265 family protein [Flavobacteriaceae bacterium]|nr:DUF6265 family protein [Flavobacteriaceae bacterium]